VWDAVSDMNFPPFNPTPLYSFAIISNVFGSLIRRL
jgi:hypothetical protein